MSKVWFLTLCWFSCSTLFAVQVIVPAPPEALRAVDTVAVGTLQKRGDSWEIMLFEVLKGDYHAGQVVSMSAPHMGGVLGLPYFAEAVGNEKFLFLGRTDSTTRTLQPAFSRWAAWPQGMTKNPEVGKTVDECVAYAKRVLGITTAPPISPVSAQNDKTYHQEGSATSQPEIPDQSSARIEPRRSTWFVGVAMVVSALWLLRFALKRRAEKQ